MSTAIDVVIGLEVHVQVRTQMKMFCRCPNQFGSEPNTNVCPICLGYPGTLPVPNEEAIRKVLIAGMMCDCELARVSKFDRKSYFYPDMPKNYQTSQYDKPFCGPGHLRIAGKALVGEVGPRDIGITRIHLEEDTGKLTHFAQSSGIDFNRAGMPLMEIVSEPDMKSADEAYAYLVGLKQIMQYADIGDCDMEKGQMRCDVNISVRRPGAPLNTKTEIKNLNSFKSVHRAIEYEIERQSEMLESGAKFLQTTRGWDDDRGETILQRVKENADDYRYFPCPDLMPIELSEAFLDGLRATLPERPVARRDRFVTQFELPPYDAEVLTLDKPTADYFEAVVATGVPAKRASNWVMTELKGALSEANLELAASPVSSAQLAALLALIEKGTINNNIGKKVFAKMFATGKPADVIVKEEGLVQVVDTGEITKFVEQAIAANPGPADEFRQGKEQALNFLVGQVMRLSRGKANPQAVTKLLRDTLGQ